MRDKTFEYKLIAGALGILAILVAHTAFSSTQLEEPVIRVELPGESSEAPVLSAGSVNLNTCTKEELTALPGIGNTLAKRILEYRTVHGRFQSVEELLQVEGIGEEKFEAIREYLTIE